MDKTLTGAPGQPNSPLLKEVDETEMLFTALLTVHYKKNLPKALLIDNKNHLYHINWTNLPISLVILILMCA